MEHRFRVSLDYSLYFAPRGKVRLMNMGDLLAQRYLDPMDKLIGFIGDAGAGKSSLVRGMFPGLELTNDDEGINVRPLPILKTADISHFSSHTYHIDVRFESAFTQMHVLVDAIKKAIEADRRVIVEHFDIIYPYLGMNAQLIIGVGEEIIVTRPAIFGPLPEDIKKIVFESLKYRLMAHTAEDLTCLVLEKHLKIRMKEVIHTDVKHGFVLEFKEKLNIDLNDLEDSVKEMISNEWDICYYDENHIKIGEKSKFQCTGPRMHVKNTSLIENFRILKEFRYDPISKLYALAGLIGNEDVQDNHNLNKLNL